MSTDAHWVADLPGLARQKLPEEVYDYVAQGSRHGVTAGEATRAWRGHRLHPHILRDVTDVDVSVVVLGQRLAIPWGVAPMTLQRAVHPEGELAVARATARSGGLMVVSSNAGATVEDIAATGVRWWLQAYLPSDRTQAVPLLERAVAAGAGAVVLTVDTPVVATKYAADRTALERRHPHLTGVDLPHGVDLLHGEARPPGAEKALDLGPHDLDWLAETTGLPVVVKGVLRADDAERCVQAGVSAVWVSNHGGRQLDRSAATAAVLPDVVAAVDGRAEVYVDGGLRDGLDVVTALALGARAVFVGRPVMWALVDGAPGVRRLNYELRDQVVEALRLAGCSEVAGTRGIASPAELRASRQAAEPG